MELARFVYSRNAVYCPSVIEPTLETAHRTVGSGGFQVWTTSNKVILKSHSPARMLFFRLGLNIVQVDWVLNELTVPFENCGAKPFG
jgi:hypothetical protein